MVSVLNLDLDVFLNLGFCYCFVFFIRCLLDIGEFFNFYIKFFSRVLMG